MIQHIVLVEVPQEAESRRDEIVQLFQSFPGKIPGVVDVVAGNDFSGRCKPYSIAAIVHIDTREHLDGYATHPAHQALLELLEEIGARRIVADFDA